MHYASPSGLSLCSRECSRCTIENIFLGRSEFAGRATEVSLKIAIAGRDLVKFPVFWPPFPPLQLENVPDSRKTDVCTPCDGSWLRLPVAIFVRRIPVFYFFFFLRLPAHLCSRYITFVKPKLNDRKFLRPTFLSFF